MSIRDVLAAASSSTALAGRDVQWMYFTESKVFTPSQDMEVNIHVIGGFATGGAAWFNSVGGANCTGGGGPGYAVKRATLKAGVSYTVTIGAAGAAASAGSANTRSNGNDGSPSSFVGGTLNIVANGGKGGVATAINVAALGGAGGTATGGDKNYPGGRGGNIAPIGAANSSVRATGAGALNLLGTGDCNGGDLTATTLVNNIFQVTGGGSCTASAPSSSLTSSIAENSMAGGDLALIDGNTSTAVTLLNRAFFGKYNTIGPSGQSAAGSGNFGGGAAGYAPGLFGGGGARGSTGTAVTASGGGYGSAGGAVSTSGVALSNSARAGAVFIEILG